MGPAVGRKGRRVAYALAMGLVVAVFLPIFAGCRGPIDGWAVQAAAVQAAEGEPQEPAEPEAPRDLTSSAAHFATAVTLHLEAVRLEQLFNYQRMSTGTRQPSLRRDAGELRKQAIEELDAALSDDPGSGVVLRRKGDMLLELARVDEALAAYREADAAAPAAAQWYFRTAGRLEMAGRAAEAGNLLRGALDDGGISGGELREVALLELGRIYKEAGRYAEAEEALRAVVGRLEAAPGRARTPLGRALRGGLRKDPTRLRRLLVEVLVAGGKLEAAAAEARVAMRRAPKDARALKALVDALLAAGAGEEAVEAAREFVEKNASSQIGALTLMRLLAAEGRADEAVAAGEEYLKSNADDQAVRTEVLKIFKKTGQTGEAEEFARTSPEGEPGYPASLALLEVYVAGKAADKAFELAERILRENPLDVKAAGKVMLRLFAGFSGDGIAEFVEAYTEKFPGDLRARYAYAVVVAGRGGEEEAAEIFVTLAEKGAPYGAVYERAAVYLVGKGRAYEGAVLLLDGVEGGFVGRPEGVSAHIIRETGEPGKAAGRLETKVGEYEFARTTLYRVIAGLYLEADEDVKAEEFYRKALEDPVVMLSDHAGLVIALYRQDRVDEAIGLVEELRAKGQGAPPLMRMLVAMLSEDGRHEEARELAERLIADLPTDLENHLALVNAFLEREDYEAAEKELLVAQDLAFGDKEALGRVRYLLGIVYDEQGKDAAAVQMWRANLKLSPDDANSNNAMAYHYAERGENLEEALELVGKALAADAGNAAYLDTLGWIYYKMGDFRKAAEKLSEAAAKMSDPVIFDHLGDALVETGDIDGALEAWGKALARKPKPRDRDRIEEKIRANSPADGE